MIRSIIFNFLGQFVTLVIAVIALPITIAHYGIGNYGIIALVASAFGASIILDLGLGRTTTKFVAEKTAKRDVAGAVNVVWASITIQAAIGAVVSILCLVFYEAIASWQKVKILRPDEVETIVRFVALAFPFVLVNGSLRGALEGLQRFGLVNLVKGVQNSSLYLVPVVCGLLHVGLVRAIVAICVTRILVTALFVCCCAVVFRGFWTFDVRGTLRDRRLLQFSGWLALSNIAVAFLINGDRPLLAYFGGAVAVGSYAIPMEIVNGLSVVTGCITAVLLPVFSARMAADPHAESLARIFALSVRSVLLILFPVAAVLVVDSHLILARWQGLEIAAQCSTPLRVVVVALVVNALGWVPTTLAYGAGRADIPVRYQLAQIPMMLLLAWWLIPRFGATGAAWIFLVRVTFETVGMFWSAHSVLLPGRARLIASCLGVRRLLILPALAVIFGFVSARMETELDRMLTLGAFLGVFAACWWGLVADETERSTVIGLIRRPLRLVGQ